MRGQSRDRLLDGFSPMTLLLVKLSAASAVLWAVLLVRGIRPAPAKWRVAHDPARCGCARARDRGGRLRPPAAYTTGRRSSHGGAQQAPAAGSGVAS
jgi:hypothetical protein